MSDVVRHVEAALQDLILAQHASMDDQVMYGALESCFNALLDVLDHVRPRGRVSVRLPTSMLRDLDALVESGRFQDRSKVVRAAMESLLGVSK